MRGACLTESVLHYARISCDDETYELKLYEGICETTFKKRYAYKKSLMRKITRTILNYLNTKQQIINFTQGYAGV